MTTKVRTGGVFVDIGSSTPGAPAWVRPPDWLPLPAVNVGDKKFVGLYAVYPGDGNFIALSAAGAYTVDWGDGSAPESIATNVQSNHRYLWTDVSSSTLTSAGYRQVVVTVTPQGAGNLTTLNIAVRNSSTSVAYVSGWLDIRIASAQLSSLTIQNPVVPRRLQQFEYVGPSSLSGTNSLFATCTLLASVVGTQWTSGMGVLTGMFSGCSSLASIPLLDIGAATSMANMFTTCTALVTIPLLNTSNVTSMVTMFSGCSSLVTIPLLNTSSVTTMTNMFTNCISLTTIPLLDVSSVTTMANMFAGCTVLTSIPLLNSANCLIFTAMFSGCPHLTTVPLLNTAKGTNFAQMFINCLALKSIPLLDTGLGTLFTGMFSGCLTLVSIPLLNTGLGTDFSTMFYNCFSLPSVPALDVHSGTLFTSMFQSCVSLQSAPLSGATRTISFTQLQLSGPALDAVYTGLGTANGAQTITVTGNWGTATDTPAIATGKGWTVTGS